MKEITLETLLDRILCADKQELNSILDAAAERFSEVWPEWELMTLSVEGHTPESRLKALHDALQLAEHLQEK